MRWSRWIYRQCDALPNNHCHETRRKWFPVGNFHGEYFGLSRHWCFRRINQPQSQYLNRVGIVPNSRHLRWIHHLLNILERIVTPFAKRQLFGAIVLHYRQRANRNYCRLAWLLNDKIIRMAHRTIFGELFCLVPPRSINVVLRCNSAKPHSYD